MIRAVALVMLLMIAPARAQDAIFFAPPPPGLGGVPALQAFANSNGPVTTSGTLFATAFAAINDPLQAGVNGVIGNLAGWIQPILRAASILALIVFIIAECISGNVSAHIAENVVLRTVVRSGALIWLVGSGAVFSQWISGPLLNLPNEISGIVLNGVDGAIPKGGAAFDTLFNHISAACATVADNAPLSFKGLGLEIAALLIWAAAGFAIGCMFLFYLMAYVLLSLVIAISPIFVAALVFPPAHRFFWGWLSAAVGCITTLVLIALLLAVLTKAIGQVIDQVMNAPPNANIFGMLGSIIGVGVLTFIGALLVKEIKAISTGIAGGIRDNSHHAIAASAGSVASAVGNAASATSGGGSSSAPASAAGATPFAGRNLGRGP